MEDHNTISDKGEAVVDEKYFNILVVDNKKSEVCLIQALLKDFSYNDYSLHFFSASSYSAAEDILRNTLDIAIVILNLQIEGNKPALSLVQLIRDNLQNTTTRIIVLNADNYSKSKHYILSHYDINNFNKSSDFAEELFLNTITFELRNFIILQRQMSYQHELEMAYLTLSECSVRQEVQKNELQHYIDTQDKLYAIIAHDLKSSVGNILSFSGMIKKNYYKYSDEKKLEFINFLNLSAVQSHQLLENLLEWTRSQTGRIKFHPTFVDLHTLTKQTLKILSSLSTKKQIAIKNTIREGAMVYADKDMLATILRNLIANAIKYTYEEGSILIKSTTEDQTLSITVADNGVGMTDDQIEKIKGYSNSISLQGTNDEKGTGLGLLICNDFLKKHCTQLDIQSTIGKGSSFSFSLPVEKMVFITD